MEKHRCPPGSRRASPGPRPIALAAALVSACALPLAWCAAFLPEGIIPEFVAYHLSLGANLLIAALAYGSLVGLPALVCTCLLTRLFPRHPKAQKVSACVRALLLALIPATLAAWMSPAIYWPLHHKAVRAVPPRAQQLVAAIDRYQQDHGAPPPQLEALLPNYLGALPGTGLAAFPRFAYRVLPENAPHPHRYELFAPCPYSHYGPSALVYWPRENGYLVSWPQDAAWRWDDGDWVYVNMR